MTARRLAFVSGVDRYNFVPNLRQCVEDAKALKEVLADGNVGAFNHIEELVDFHRSLFCDALSAFLGECGTDDVVLVHISSHMGADQDGRLIIVAADTEPQNSATAIKGAWLIAQLNACASRRLVLILDGCHSASIGDDDSFRGFDAASAAGLAGRGRVVIASASATGAAYEHTNKETPRTFTDILARGMKSGDADVDGDGLISAFELYEYGYNETLKHFNGIQVPSLRMFGGTPASITVAYSRQRIALGTTIHATNGLPVGLRNDLKSDLEKIRVRAVWRLFDLVEADDDPTRTQALLALFELSQDSNEAIRGIVHWRLTAGGEWWTSGTSRTDLATQFPRNEPVDWKNVLDALRRAGSLEVNVTGDFNVVSAGGDAKGNALGRKNKVKYTETAPLPKSVDDLGTAIEALAEDVSASDKPVREKAPVVSSLLWWAENIADAHPPAEAEQHASILQRAGGWAWDRFLGLVEAMPAATLAAWVFEVVKGMH